MFAVVLVLFASLCRWSLNTLLDDSVPYITFFPAVMVAAWWAGWRSALLTTILSALLAWFLFLPPAYHFFPLKSADLLGLVVFVGVNVGVVLLADRFWAASRSLKQFKRRAGEQFERIRVTLASIGDAVITTDLAGRVLELNRVAEELTGWNRQDVFALPFAKAFDIIDESTSQPVASVADRALRDEAYADLGGQAILRARDGSTKIVDYRAAAIKNVKGTITGCILVFRDVSARRESERAIIAGRDKLDFILSSTGLGTWFNELPLGDLNWDALTREFFYVQEGETPTIEMFYDRLHPEDRERTRHAVDKAVAEGTLFDVEYRVVNPRGEGYRWIWASGRTGYDDQGIPRTFDGICKDITAEKIAQDQLRERDWSHQFLLDLGDQTRPLTDVATIVNRASALLGRKIGADRVAYADVDAMESRVRCDWEWQSGSLRNLAGIYPLSDYSLALREALSGGNTVVVADYESDGRFSDQTKPYIVAGCRSFIVVPLVKNNNLINCLIVMSIPPRSWTHGEIELVNQTADRLWEAVERARAEQQLRRSHETFFRLVQDSPLCVFIVDSHWKLMHTSVGARDVFRNIDPLLGRDIAQVIHLIWNDPFATEMIDHIRHTLETGEPHRGYSEEKPKDAEAIPIHDWVIERIVLPDGRFGVACNFKDTRELRLARHMLKESEERFRLMADNIAQLAWICDDLGDVTWYNRRWIEYTGFSFEEMKGWGWSKLHHPEHIDRVVAKIKEAARTGATWEDTFPLRGNDGQYRWFLSRAVPIRDEAEKVTRWFGTNTDITEQLAAEQSLRDADRRKDEFLATLAHELRNPLAPLSNAMTMLRISEKPWEVFDNVRDILDQQIENLVRMVDDLLEVSRISSGKLDVRKENISLQKVISNALATSQPLLSEKRHELIVNVLPPGTTVHVDPLRMSQVISNLINNAAKYTDPEGCIRVDVTASDGELVISVKDTGIGIPPDRLESIFEMFSQVEYGLNRSLGGLGIGLTLVRNYVAMHGGKVSAHSEGLGKGSEFVVRVPTLISSERADHEESEAPIALPKRSVLVVDDTKAAAMLLGKMLEALGQKVRVCTNPEEAVGIAVEDPPEMIFSDIAMPKLDGYTLARNLRQEPTLQNATLVALTGFGQDSDRQQALDAGFHHHLVKPVGIDQLRKILVT